MAQATAAGVLIGTEHWICTKPAALVVEGFSAFGIGQDMMIATCTAHRSRSLDIVRTANLSPSVMPITLGAGRCGTGVVYE